MFQTVPLSIIRSFSLCTQQCACHTGLLTACEFRTDPARKLSANLYDIYHCCLYSETPLMMDRGTAQNMQSFIPKINLRN